ncbi:MAG TPA: hypothetical protein VEW93_06505 [Acidimicrobiales bacterium]|nr:hypothetical protein [Acidimicrobiales bacterium]
MRPADTHPDAWAVQRALHKAMTGEERLALAFAMAEEARKVSRAGQAFRAQRT